MENFKTFINYDEKTGIFTRIKTFNGKKEISVRADSLIKTGYSIVTYKRKQYKAHRLAWFYVHGHMPIEGIDHIDGNPSNNAIANLRLADSSKNNQNKIRPQSNNKSGFLGVRLTGNANTKKPYKAEIRINYKNIYIGCYSTPEQAHEAYLQKKREIHEFCTI